VDDALRPLRIPHAISHAGARLPTTYLRTFRPTGFSVALGLHHGVNRDIPSLWHDRALATGARGEADPDPTPEYLARPPRRLVATASAAVRTDVSEVGRARGTTEGEGRDSCDRPVRVPMLASGRGAP
jgi:hypothetical protein